MTDAKDFKDMMFNVFKTKHGTDLYAHFPGLRIHDEFRMGSDPRRNDFTRYIFYVYDKNSPLIKQYRGDIQRRKEEALKLTRFKKNKRGEYEETVQALIEGRYKDEDIQPIFDCIMKFLSMQNSHIWMEICTLETEYEEYMRLRWEPVNDAKDKDTLMAAEKKSKLRDESSKILKALKDYYSEFFGDNKDIEDEVKVVKINSPEQFANRFMG